MKAMILAAGLGERLRPLTNELPKPLVPVANRPIIEYNLRLLKKYGIQEVAVNLHHLGDKIQDHLGDGRRFGLQITYSREPRLLGTGGGIRRLQAFFGHEAFIVINADILIDIDLMDLVVFHRAQGALATMALRPNEDVVRYGTIHTDDGGRIREFLGKLRAKTDTLHPWMFTGVHVMEPGVFERMPDQESFCINRDVYAQWVRAGHPCYGYLHRGYWRDLGTPTDYLQANLDLLETDLAFAPPEDPEGTFEQSPQASLTAPCKFGAGSVVAGDAVVGPGVVLGAGSHVSAGARVARSVLWPDARIEAGEVVEQMIVTRFQRVHAASQDAPSLP